VAIVNLGKSWMAPISWSLPRVIEARVLKWLNKHAFGIINQGPRKLERFVLRRVCSASWSADSAVAHAGYSMQWLMKSSFSSGSCRVQHAMAHEAQFPQWLMKGTARNGSWSVDSAVAHEGYSTQWLMERRMLLAYGR
jgi:hypothetical protein